MATTYTYLGQITRGYFSYVDTETQHMLVAEPGGVYGIRAVEPHFVVPPGDGNWEATPVPPVSGNGGGNRLSASPTSSSTTASADATPAEAPDQTGDQE